MVLVVFVLDAAFNVCQPGAGAVLVPFQRGEVDGVGEVGGEEPVGPILQSSVVRGEFGQFVGSGELAEQLSERGRNPEEFAAFQASFAEVGVKRVYVEAFPGRKLDGCALIVDESP